MVEKQAYSIDELLTVHPGGRTALYAAIKRGELVAHKIGRRTVVLVENYSKYLRALPQRKSHGEKG